MSRMDFLQLIAPVTEAITGKALDAALESFLNETYPAGGETFRAIEQSCHVGIEAGWMCEREVGGIRFGRVFKPGVETAGFSVDVVRMDSVRGPHHRHPNGEIDLILPISPEAQFDGAGAGWKVYEPDSAHHPTVTDGAALILYLLPDGKIEFTAT